MSEDVDTNFWSPSRKPRRHFTGAAREASKATLAAKRAQPVRFGEPEVFVTVTGGKAFAWELRRFGGIVLQRSGEVFSDAAAAREAGEQARAVLIATPGLPTFRKERQ